MAVVVAVTKDKEEEEEEEEQEEEEDEEEDEEDEEEEDDEEEEEEKKPLSPSSLSSRLRRSPRGRWYALAWPCLFPWRRDRPPRRQPLHRRPQRRRPGRRPGAGCGPNHGLCVLCFPITRSLSVDGARYPPATTSMSVEVAERYDEQKDEPDDCPELSMRSRTHAVH